MLSSTIGPHHTPNPPQPKSLAPTASEKIARKAATSAKLRQKTTDSRNDIAHRVLSQGQSDRKWSSLRPNENYLNAVVSLGFGRLKPCRDLVLFDSEEYERAKARAASEVFDRDAHDDAIAVSKAWVQGPTPWKGMVRGKIVCVEETTETGHWGSLCAQQPLVEAETALGVGSLTRVSEGRMTTDAINDAYESYARCPDTELDNLKAALFEFAPLQKRRERCDDLLKTRETYVTPDDILADFLIDLFDRLEKGQYHTHERKFHHWIATMWRFFFAGFETKFRMEDNLTAFVNEDDCDDEDAENVERISGELYRMDVDREQAKRDASSPSVLIEQIYRDLGDPATDWGKVSPAVKIMMRRMREGATQAEAAHFAGITERHGRRLMNDAVSSINDSNAVLRKVQACADDCVIDLQASADDAFEPLLDVEEAAVLLRCHPKTVQALCRAGNVPCIRMGKYWRFRASALDLWVREGLQSDHQSRRAS